jgi:hypothetical protein
MGTGQAVVAQEVRSPEPGARAWKKVAEGVWQRRDADGALVTVTRGVDGMKWAAREMERELVNVVEYYRAEPTPERFEQLAKHLDNLAEIRVAAQGKPAGKGASTGTDGTVSPACNSYVIYTAAASAGPLNSGAWASSEAHFSVVHNYSPYCPGNAYARANASVTSGGVTTSQSQVCSKPSDLVVDCSAYASVAGTGTCKSDSFSYASYPSWGYYTSRSAQNCGCGPFAQACAEVLPAEQ